MSATIETATSVTRRRLLAGLGAVGLAPAGALGLLPRAALAAEDDKRVCSVARTTYDGLHRLSYHLTNKKLSDISATMRFDMDGLEWTTADMVLNGNDSRDLNMMDDRVAVSSWGRALIAYTGEREKAVNDLPAGQERDFIASQLEQMRMSAYVTADMGWLDLQLKAGRGPDGKPQLQPAGFSVQFPPLGVPVGLTNDTIKIVIFADDLEILTLDYTVTEVEKALDGVGPAPLVNVTRLPEVAPLAQALVAKAAIVAKAFDTAGEQVFELKLIGLQWAEEFAAVTALQPQVVQLARDYISGNDNVCEKDGCYLTTAAVVAVGLADDCWELTTLRAYRDGWLAGRAEGRAVIADYYRLAPALVATIDRRPDARRVWLATWAFGIVPAALAARMGLNRTALRLYRAMTRRLQRLARV